MNRRTKPKPCFSTALTKRKAKDFEKKNKVLRTTTRTELGCGHPERATSYDVLDPLKQHRQKNNSDQKRGDRCSRRFSAGPSTDSLSIVRNLKVTVGSQLPRWNSPQSRHFRRAMLLQLRLPFPILRRMQPPCRTLCNRNCNKLPRMLKRLQVRLLVYYCMLNSHRHWLLPASLNSRRPNRGSSRPLPFLRCQTEPLGFLSIS